MKKCKIVVKDEVNCKLVGLDLPERKALMRMFEVEVPGARFLPAVKLGRWNGKISYFTLGGSTYINLLPEILPYLDQLSYDIEIEDLRDYNTSFTFNKVSEALFEGKTWPKGHLHEHEPIILRDYQVGVINSFLFNTQSLQEVPTGSGKTIITAALSYLVESYGRTIIVVPNKDLVTQTEEDYINVGLDVGVYFGDRKEWNRKHTICTWQSLNHLLKNGTDGDLTIADFISGVVCVIVDEAHSVKADVLKALLTGAFSQIPIRWGFTGTIPKDKFSYQSLLVSLGSVVNKLAASDLQDRGVLAQCHVNIIQLQDGLEFTNYQSELKHLLEDQKRLDTIAELINKVKDSGNTLVLVDRVNAGKELISRIPNSVFVSGGTKLTDRKQEYAEIAVSDNKVVIATYGVAAVGINIPRIFNLVLIEAGKSFVRVIQSIGRGIRKAEDKDNVMIWDITSNCKFAKKHLTQRKTYYNEAKYPFSIEKLTYR